MRHIAAGREGPPEAVILLERFRTSVRGKAEALARREEFDACQESGGHHAGVRRWAPAFLDASEFGGVPAVAQPPRAVAADVLHEVDRAASPRLWRSVAAGPERRCYWQRVLPGLRAGRVRVAGSRRYRSRRPESARRPAAAGDAW